MGGGFRGLGFKVSVYGSEGLDFGMKRFRV